MQMCPDCGKVYDESEYAGCPYCSGELDDDDDYETDACPNCGCTMYWIDDHWECSNCDYTNDEY